MEVTEPSSHAQAVYGSTYDRCFKFTPEETALLEIAHLQRSLQRRTKGLSPFVWDEAMLDSTPPSGGSRRLGSEKHVRRYERLLLGFAEYLIGSGGHLLSPEVTEGRIAAAQRLAAEVVNKSFAYSQARPVDWEVVEGWLSSPESSDASVDTGPDKGDEAEAEGDGPA